MINLNDKRVAVLGLGVENLSLVPFLVKNGAYVTVCDKNVRIKNLKGDKVDGVKEWRVGQDYLNNLTDFDVVFRSPGVSRLTPEILKAESKGVEISSSIKSFFDLCEGKIIGITGTKGKGTCAMLVYEILKRSYRNSGSKVYLAGNFGIPAISLVDKIKPLDWVIVELSSFQLQDLQKSPYIAVVLNITSDHLDYHKTKKEYIEAKQNIILYQVKKDYAVINLDYLTSFEFAALTKGQVYWFSRKKSVDRGCFIKWQEIHPHFGRFGDVILRIGQKDHLVCKTFEINLFGLHNLENICAASTVAYLAKAKIKDIKKVATTFKGLEHRLEFVDEINGVRFVNDSFSTIPESTIAALQSFSAPVILICGGRSKKGDYKRLVDEISRSSVKTLILIGEMAGELGSKIKEKKANRKIINLGFSKMNKIVYTAFKEASREDIVLLSPGCTSFDMFQNASDRGKQFKKVVKKLK